MTSTASILKRLKEGWGIRETEYGEATVIIPKRDWPSLPVNWQKEAEGEGAKVFQNSWDGELAFFVKVPDKQKPNSATTKKWSHNEIQQLKELASLGLNSSEIGSKLGRSGSSVRGKMRKLNLNNPRTARTPASTGNGDDAVKELLSACSMLYPSHRTACAYLLREASNRILREGAG